MTTTPKIVEYKGRFDEKFYYERINRSLGWMGDNLDEQLDRQHKLKNITVGVAGTGGIGGSTAARLVRAGCINIKIADIDNFDTSNIQRQMGAEISNLGRNKSQVVSEIIFGISGDCNIKAYTDGINADNAEDFVSGCDIILDQIDVYAVDAHYALHRAFRNYKKCKFIITALTIGHCAYLFKYTHDSMPIEEVYGIPDKKQEHLTEDEVRLLISRIIPVQPDYPSRKMFDEWWVENRVVSIFAGCPPLCEGILTERVLLEIMEFPDFTPMPVQPGYAIFDAAKWETTLYSGKWW